MIHPKKFKGTTLKKGARLADSDGLRVMASKYSSGIPTIENEESREELIEILKSYVHQSQNSLYIPNNKLKNWLQEFIKTKQAEIKLILGDVGVANEFYVESLDIHSSKIRSQISDAKEKLIFLEGQPSHAKGDYLENDLILKLLKFRKRHGLTAGYTHDPYSGTNDSTGECVPWIAEVLNDMCKQVGKEFSNQAVKERIKKILSQNRELN